MRALVVCARHNRLRLSIKNCRYYIHATDFDGLPVFPMQSEIEQNKILYGLQFDLDSSRLVGLALPKMVKITSLVLPKIFFILLNFHRRNDPI